MKILNIFTFITMMLVLTLISCGRGDHHESVEIEPVSVSLTPVTTRLAGSVISAPGSVTSGREATLSSRIMGQVIQKHVRAGDMVHRGAVLLELDDRTVKGQIAQARGALAQAEAAKNLAETNAHRFRELFEKKAASQLELDMAETQFRQASGAVSQAEGAVMAAESMLDDAVIRAAFTGRILDVMVKEGDMAAPGYPLIRMEDRSRLQLKVEVKESDLETIRSAESIFCSFPSADLNDFPCRIAELVSAADPMTHTFTVKLSMEDHPAIRSGMYGKAVFHSSRKSSESRFVPETALVTRGQLHMVFSVDNDHAVMNVVRVGGKTDGLIEILSGLNGVDRVINDGAARMSHGQRVEIEP